MALRLVLFLLSWPSFAVAQQQAVADGSTLVGFDGCSSGAHGATWISVKKKIRGLFPRGVALEVTNKKILLDIYSTVFKELKDGQALSPSSTECGLGRISFQLLYFLTNEAEVLLQMFSSSEKLASPVLTSLLDVPWLVIAESGWPIFGLLSEINLQKRIAGVKSRDPIDGLDKPLGQAFYKELMEALIKGDGAAIGQVTNLYLTIDSKDKNSLASLTAVVAGAASSEVRQRMELMDLAQNGLKQLVGNAMELDIALCTQWPIWALMHAAVDIFAV